MSAAAQRLETALPALVAAGRVVNRPRQFGDGLLRDLPPLGVDRWGELALDEDPGALEYGVSLDLDESTATDQLLSGMLLAQVLRDVWTLIAGVVDLWRRR